ncbi:hypothetical protein YC2023_087755 [Brassica napus]
MKGRSTAKASALMGVQRPNGRDVKSAVAGARSRDGGHLSRGSFTTRPRGPIYGRNHEMDTPSPVYSQVVTSESMDYNPCSSRKPQSLNHLPSLNQAIKLYTYGDENILIREALHAGLENRPIGSLVFAMSPMGLGPVSPPSGNRNKLSLPRCLLCFFSSFLDDSSSQRKVDQSTLLHLCAMNPSFMGSFRISPSDFLYISILLKIVYTITIKICDEFQPQLHCFWRNQTELTEPPPLSRSNVPANPVSLPPYRSNIIILFDAKPVFLVIFISQSVQSPLRNINSPFGFHGAVNRDSTANSISPSS